MHEIPPDANLIHTHRPDCICDPTLSGDTWVHHALDGTEPAEEPAA